MSDLQVQTDGGPVIVNTGAENNPPELSAALLNAIAEVRRTYANGKGHTWALCEALAALKLQCEQEGHEYIEICQRYLAEIAAEGTSASVISRMASAGEYCRERKIDLSNAASLPSYQQVCPLYRFYRRPKRAAVLTKEWDALNDEVFAFDGAQRPTADEVNARVNSLLAPPTRKKKGDLPKPGLPAEEVTADNMAAWFTAMAGEDGKMTVHRIRVPRMTADALMVAVKAQWDALKTARFIRIEVAE